MTQPASDAAQELVIPHHILSDTHRGERILWVDLAHAHEYGVGEVVHGLFCEPPELLLTKRGKELEKISKKRKPLWELVEDDMRKAPSERIDSVVWYTYYSDHPTA